MIANDVMIALLGEEFDRKATDIANGISTSFLSTSCAEAPQQWCLLANSVQEFRTSVLGKTGIRNFELAPCSDSFCVDHPVSMY